MPYFVGFLDHISIMGCESRLVWRNFCSESQVSQSLAGLESGSTGSGDLDLLFRLRVAADAGGTLPDFCREKRACHSRLVKTSNVMLLFYTTSEVYTNFGMVSKQETA